MIYLWNIKNFTHRFVQSSLLCNKIFSNCEFFYKTLFPCSGFCFVEFDNEDVVEKLVKKQFHEVATKTVNIYYYYSYSVELNKNRIVYLVPCGFWHRQYQLNKSLKFDGFKLFLLPWLLVQYMQKSLRIVK